MAEPSDMRERILDAAQALVQSRGYEGFSYADISEAVGIRKASVHHHFPTKGDLGRRLVGRFREACRARFERIDREAGGPRAKLRAYVELFRATLLDGGRMCLCGMLAANFASLTPETRADLVEALADHERWLAGVLREGRAAGVFRAGATPSRQARTLVAGLEGAMLLARLHDDLGRFLDAARDLLGALEVAPARRAKAVPRAGDR